MEETMKLLVKNISPEEGDDTYESWIYIQLENKVQLEVYNPLFFDLQNFIGKRIEGLIEINILRNVNKIPLKSKYPLIEGKYITNYEIPPKWLKSNKDLPSFNYDAIETSDGIFLVAHKRIEKENIIKNEFISLYAVKFVLVAWLPIE